LHGCTVPVERSKPQSVDRPRFADDQLEGHYDDRIIRCDEETTVSAILLILFIAVTLAVHQGMVHRFGSPYR
jgi:hypothetical protein